MRASLRSARAASPSGSFGRKARGARHSYRRKEIGRRATATSDWRARSRHQTALRCDRPEPTRRHPAAAQIGGVKIEIFPPGAAHDAANAETRGLPVMRRPGDRLAGSGALRRKCRSHSLEQTRARSMPSAISCHSRASIRAANGSSARCVRSYRHKRDKRRPLPAHAGRRY